jgi:predicted ribosomally synthesized peptide with SipW-like signal peptide
MKKNVSIIALAVSLIASIAIGSTLAFFTSQAEVNNTVSMGDVKISLTEPTFKDSGIVPGETISKAPTVTNIGSHKAYIRCKLDIELPEEIMEEYKSDKNPKAQLLDGIAFGDDAGSADLWVLGNDGFYYYQKELPAGESVKFFRSVTIPAVWDNTFADKSFEINVTAQAIQADNYKPVEDAQNHIVSWTYNDGSSEAPVTILP